MSVIFVVEPDAVLAHTYAEAIKGLGYVVYKFRTAALAVKALEKVVPDLIVLEIALPAHNGLELLYEMKSYTDTRSVRVIVNSFIQPHLMPWGFLNRGEIGIVEHLYKPLSRLEGLQRAVREYA